MAKIKKKTCKSGHPLYDKVSKQNYVCNGCKMSGQGLTYRCETCDYDLHKECMFSEPMISHEIFEQGYEFKFFKLPPPGKLKSCKEKKCCLKCRNCDVCGMPVKGFVYHCKETDADLHPRCALLKKEIIVQSDLDHQLDLKFVLKKGIMSSKNCNECQRAELPGADKKIPGWCYVSEDHGEFRFHVYCMMQMCMKSSAKAKSDVADGSGGGGGGIRGGVAKIIENPKVELQKKGREIYRKKKGGTGGRRTEFYIKIFKSILATVVSILIGVFFDGTRQRQPRLRFGKVHLYNNYTRNWGIYAVCASVEAQIFSQCNIYEAGQKKTTFMYYTEKAADKEKEATGSIRSEADLFINGAQSGLRPLYCEDSVFHPSEFYPTWTVEPPSESLKHVLQHCTGWQCVPQIRDQPYHAQVNA